MVPRIQACLKVSTLDPTEVPKELATSFAPMAKLRIKAMINPTMTSHNTSSGMWTILHWFWKKNRRKKIIFIIVLGCELFFTDSEKKRRKKIIFITVLGSMWTRSSLILKKKWDQFNQRFLRSCTPWCLQMLSWHKNTLKIFAEIVLNSGQSTNY